MMSKHPTHFAISAGVVCVGSMRSDVLQPPQYQEKHLNIVVLSYFEMLFSTDKCASLIVTLIGGQNTSCWKVWSRATLLKSSTTLQAPLIPRHFLLLQSVSIHLFSESSKNYIPCFQTALILRHFPLLQSAWIYLFSITR